MFWIKYIFLSQTAGFMVVPFVKTGKEDEIIGFKNPSFLVLTHQAFTYRASDLPMSIILPFKQDIRERDYDLMKTVLDL